MRNLLTAVLVVGFAAATAGAGILPGYDFALVYDTGGNAWLRNDASAALSVDSYEIWSAGDRLDPDGWLRFGGPQPIPMPPPPHPGGSWDVWSGDAGLLTEGCSSAPYGTFEPGVSYSIGKPLVAPPDPDDLDFFYTKPGVVGDKFIGNIIPEPATLALLAVGAMAAIRRRRPTRTAGRGRRS